MTRIMRELRGVGECLWGSRQPVAAVKISHYGTL